MKKRTMLTAAILLMLTLVLPYCPEAAQELCHRSAAVEAAGDKAETAGIGAAESETAGIGAAESETAGIGMAKAGAAESEADTGGIQGEDALQIAVQGESLAVFSVAKGYSFLPIREKGVRFDEKTGRLTTTPEAKEQTITVVAVSEASGKRLSREVVLYKSWRLSSDTPELAGFPNPDEVKRPETAWLRFFRGGRLLALRAAVLALTILPAAAYVFLRKKDKGSETELKSRADKGRDV